VAKLERALFLSALADAAPDGCTRLYFGAEFCPWRMPDAATILSARDWASSCGLDFTLVTPLLGEGERLRLQRLLQGVLPAFNSGDEVVISDWGTLAAVRAVRDDLELILGRALSGQKRGPRILDMELGDAQRDYFRQGSWYAREAVTLLHEQGIARVELDNLLQGIAPLPAALHGSLHLPLALVTSSRNCPFREALERGLCSAPCGELFVLRTPQTSVPLYQDGNSQFLLNETPPGDLAALGIDRIVEHPHPLRR
jgi:hypothetical protein